MKLAGTANIYNLYQVSYPLEKISAAIIASLSVVVFFFILNKIEKNTKKNIFFALLFGLGTQTFSISGQLLWQHGTANLLLIISQLFFVEAILRKKRNFFIYSIILGTLCFFTRPIFIIYDILLVSASIQKDRKNALSYVITFIISLIPIIFFNFYFFQNFLGGYSKDLTLFNLNIFSNFAGLIFSPSKGIVFFTPVFLYAFIAPILKRNNANKPFRPLLIVNYLFLVGVLLINSVHGIWWGGRSFGDRLMADGAVSAVLITYFYFTQPKSLFLKVLVVFVVLYSFLVQFVGAYFYPRGDFDGYPKDINYSDSGSLGRLWDFRDSSLSRALLVGPELMGIARFYYSLKGVDYARVYSEKDTKCSLKLVGEYSQFGYKMLAVEITNLSKTDWVMYGKNPIDIRSTHVKKIDISSYESSIPSTPLPFILRSGTKAKVDIVQYPPDNEPYLTVISPVQEGVGWWDKSCSLQF